MAKSRATIVRAFDGSLADAEGLLAVERASFDESPYNSHQVRDMLAEGPQRAWLAVDGSVVVGFVVSFATYSLGGPVWEIDLLAVRPSWRGHGLATRLVRASCAYGAGLAGQARSVVSADNKASGRVFRRVGFKSVDEACGLYIFRVREGRLPPAVTHGIDVRSMSDPAGIPRRLVPSEFAPSASPDQHPGLRSLAAGLQANRASIPGYLVAGRRSEPEGYAELLEVGTLLYWGVWIESLVAETPAAAAALVRRAQELGRSAGLDEIGAMVPADDGLLQQVLLTAGFRCLGSFRWLKAALPLPGWATPVLDRRDVTAGEPFKQGPYA